VTFHCFWVEVMLKILEYVIEAAKVLVVRNSD
jgi:hypothetical protein